MKLHTLFVLKVLLFFTLLGCESRVKYISSSDARCFSRSKHYVKRSVSLTRPTSRRSLVAKWHGSQFILYCLQLVSPVNAPQSTEGHRLILCSQQVEQTRNLTETEAKFFNATQQHDEAGTCVTIPDQGDRYEPPIIFGERDDTPRVFQLFWLSDSASSDLFPCHLTFHIVAKARGKHQPSTALAVTMLIPTVLVASLLLYYFIMLFRRDRQESPNISLKQMNHLPKEMYTPSQHSSTPKHRIDPHLLTGNRWVPADIETHSQPKAKEPGAGSIQSTLTVSESLRQKNARHKWGGLAVPHNDLRS